MDTTLLRTLNARTYLSIVPLFLLQMATNVITPHVMQLTTHVVLHSHGVQTHQIFVISVQIVSHLALTLQSLALNLLTQLISSVITQHVIRQPDYVRITPYVPQSLATIGTAVLGLAFKLLETALRPMQPVAPNQLVSLITIRVDKRHSVLPYNFPVLIPHSCVPKELLVSRAHILLQTHVIPLYKSVSTDNVKITLEFANIGIFLKDLWQIITVRFSTIQLYVSNETTTRAPVEFAHTFRPPVAPPLLITHLVSL